MANKISLTESYIEINCDRDDTVSQHLAGQIPYIHANRTRTKFRTTIRNIDVVLKALRNIDVFNIETAPTNVQILFDREINRRIITNDLITLGPDSEHPWLWTHQQLGVELAEVNPKFGFFYDTRTGKTPMCLQIVLEDVRKHPDHKWLVLCPLILIENAWLLDGHKMFPELNILSLHGSTQADRLARFKLPANLYLQNIESFITYRPNIEKLGIYGCIVDESSTMKSPKSKFGKEAVDFAWTMKRWYLLSGSPAPNGSWEYYRQLQSLDFYSVHDSWEKFKRYFFNNVSRNPQYEKLETKPEREAELLRLLKEYTLYVDKEDVLTTPGREFITVEITLPKKLKEQYEQLRQELCIELGENLTVTAPSAAAALNKLNQISSGFIIDTLAMKRNKMIKKQKLNEPLVEESHFLDDFRFQELDKLLAKVGNEQAIIWCIYHKEFEILKQRLGNKCACIYGQVSNAEKNANIAAFKNGTIQWLVAHPASMGKGVTMTNAHYAIYFSIGYSYEDWKQSKERIYADIVKQPNFCTYYIIIAKGTVDRAIYNAVNTKGNMSLAILDHLKGLT